MLIPETLEGVANVVGFGTGSLDVILPPGQVGPDHIAGGTVGLSPEDEAYLAELSRTPGHERYLRVGGDVLNILTWLALQKEIAASYVGVIGHEDAASQAIRTELDRFSIQNRAIEMPGFRPGVHLVERADKPGSDRMVRRPIRVPDYDQVSDEHLRGVLRAAQVAVVASVKCPKFTERLFRVIPDSVAISYNPGTSRFRPDSEVLALTRERPPELLVASREELEMLYAVSGVRVEDLALRACTHAASVIVTDGKRGLVFAKNGQVARQGCTQLPRENICDKLGAGDRVHAVGVHGLLVKGETPEVVLRRADEHATRVIQNVGGHGDLDQYVQPANLSLF